jgi:hypothetical protein
MSHNETKAQRGKDATIEVPVGEKRKVALSDQRIKPGTRRRVPGM